MNPKDVYTLIPETCKQVTKQREIKVEDENKVAHQMTLQKGIILDYLNGPNVITEVLQRVGGR